MPDTGNSLTGYKGGDDSSGKGGRAREGAIMSQVNSASGLGTDAATATSGGPTHPAAPKPKPSSMAPSGDNGPRVYGSPVSTPVLGGGK